MENHRHEVAAGFSLREGVAQFIARIDAWLCPPVYAADKGNPPVGHLQYSSSERAQRASREVLDWAYMWGTDVRSNSISIWIAFCDWLCPSVYAASKGADPVAHWRFDEGGGPTAYDDTSNNNDGTLTPGTLGTNTAAGQMWTRQGKIGGALELDGTDDVVTATTTGFNSTNSYTVAMWVKPTSSKSGVHLWEGVTLSAPSIEGSSTSLYYWVGNTSYIGTGTLTVDEWYHIVASYDKSTTTQRLYVNGVLKGTNNVDVSDTFGNTFIIGNRIGWARYFPGLIDSVRIYNYARTAEQIMVDYNAGMAAYLGGGTDPNEGNPPVLYLPFDENTGTNAYDRSRNGYNGTITEATWAQGKHGSALNFDGSNDYVSVAHNSALNFERTDSFSISAWVTVDSLSNYRNIIGKNDSAYKGWSFMLFSSSDPNRPNSVSLILTNTNGSNDLLANTPTNSISPGNTYHIACTYNGNSDVSGVKIYINGVLQTVTAIRNILSASMQTTNDIWIGKHPYQGASYPMDGIIDEIKIYNYARTQAQIAYDYNKGKPVAHYKFDEGGGAISHNEYSSADSGTAPVGWWRMDEGAGTTTADATGNANTGTLNPGTLGTNTTAAGMWDQTGKIGPDTLEFDGTDDYVNCGDSPIHDLSSGATVSAWVYYRGIGVSNGIIVVKQNTTASTGAAYSLVILTASNKADFSVATANNAWADYPSNIVLSTNTWYHIVGTYTSGSLKIYINGVLDATYTTPTGNIITATGNLLIGKEDSWQNEYFNGFIDDVRIYNYARTAEQIYNDYKTTHGTLVGDTKFVDGKIGKAVQFDGTGDYVSVSDSELLDLSTAATIGAWINPNSGFTTNYRAIVYKDDLGNAYDFMTNITNGVLRVWFAGTALNGNTAVPAGQWSHVVATYDGSQIRLYLNGVLDNSVAKTGAMTNSSDPLTIGIATGGSSYPFNGKIDDVRIYNYSRSADQILQDYNAGMATRLGAQSAGVADPWGGALPVAHWRMDENTGVLARDASGNGNDGTLTNGPTWTQGKVGPALSFDGTNDYARIPISSSIQGITSAMTIAAWVYKKDTNGEMIINNHIQNYGTPISGAIFSVTTGNYPNLQLRLNNTCCQAVTSNSAIQTNQWHHLAATWDGSTMKLYTNGMLQSPTQSASGTNQMSRDLFIGINADDFFNSSFSNQFNGFIDDVKIYNYARTQAQIAWDYNYGKPVAQWRFDEGSGTTAYDDSDNNNDGTITVGAGGSQTTIGSAWTNGATGKFGKCMSFDGTDDWVETPAINIGTGPVTFSVWAKGTSLPANQERGLMVVNYAGKPWFFTLERSSYSAGSVVMYVGYPDQTPNNISGGTWAPSDTNWHHIVMTRDSNSIKLYFDGSEVANSTSTNFTNFDVGNRAIRIGYPSALYWSGLIDDIRIYNYARTSDQILQDYNQGLAVRLGD